MTSDAGFDPGITARSVTPGWVAEVVEPDGTATVEWGPTREAAMFRARGGRL